ncbi:MAG: 23S rRNA (pseudouridine(1915)-N(3))-methyltransferase RlmH [Lautropia sp.]|nr:23S rRNA (pseudouridine(1915)-N(3))-methyltransferase RlmH [Lautropia sp.]
MQIRILAVGQRAPRWVDEAVDDYLKRFPRELNVELVAVKTETRTGDPTRRTEAATATLMAREAERLRARLPARARVVVLDERGDDLRTHALARRLAHWQQVGDPVAILIGGPDGLDAGLKAEAAERIRLSSLTLPHALVRVLLAEQLYRAWSINANHPYHRE